MKRSIVIIAYYFPPITGAGVQRPLRLVKELCRNDYEVTVITSKLHNNDFDLELSEEIPKNCRVIRLSDPLASFRSGSLLSKVIMHLMYSLMIPDMMYFWYLKNRKKVLQLVKQTGAGNILTTSGPESSHLFGMEVKRKLPSINWIADFRDAYAKNPSRLISGNKIRNNKLILRIHGRCESKICYAADYVTTVSKPLLSFLRIHKNNGVVIPNGYDSETFIKSGTPEKENKYVIFYMGSLYFERDPNIFIRPFINFLDALTDEDRKLISFRIAGKSRPQELETLKSKLKKYDVLQDLGFLKHSTAVHEGIKSSTLLLLIDDVPGAETVYTGKIFEYIRMPTPILAIAPKGGAAGMLIEETRTGKVIQPGNDKEILDHLLNDFKSWKSDVTRSLILAEKNWDLIEEYNEVSLSRQWMQLLK